jgi:glycosyltransferase involved in cell wall biosynthesis
MGSMMRVLHVVATGDRRGAETFAGDLTRALAPEVEQRVLVLRSSNGVSVPFGGKVKTVAGNGSATGIRTGRAIHRVLADWRPDVVQTHGGEALKRTIPVSWRTPVVYRRIGSKDWIETTAKRRLYSGLMRRAARTVTLSERLRRETIDAFGLDPDSVVTIGNAIDPNRVRARRSRVAVRREFSVRPSEALMLWVGALAAEKDPMAAVRVADALPDTARLLLVGDGPLRPSVEAEIERLGLARRAKCVGSRDDVGDMLAAADLLLLTSVTEGVPGIAMEAATTGIPVVAFAVGGVPDAVTDGVTGVLVEPGSIEGMFEAAASLLADRDRGRSLGSAARARSARFDIGAVAARYLRLYQELCHER